MELTLIILKLRALKSRASWTPKVYVKQGSLSRMLGHCVFCIVSQGRVLTGRGKILRPPAVFTAAYLQTQAVPEDFSS